MSAVLSCEEFQEGSTCHQSAVTSTESSSLLRKMKRLEPLPWKDTVEVLLKMNGPKETKKPNSSGPYHENSATVL